MIKHVKTLAACLSALLLAGCAASPTHAPTTTRYHVAMIAKSTSTEFWSAVFAGAEAAATERMLTADQPCCRISSRLAFSISSLDVTTVFIQHLNMNNVQYRYTEFFPLSTGKKRQKAALTSGVTFVIIGRESRKAFQIFTYRR